MSISDYAMAAIIAVTIFLILTVLTATENKIAEKNMTAVKQAVKGTVAEEIKEAVKEGAKQGIAEGIKEIRRLEREKDNEQEKIKQ